MQVNFYERSIVSVSNQFNQISDIMTLNNMAQSSPAKQKIRVSLHYDFLFYSLTLVSLRFGTGGANYVYVGNLISAEPEVKKLPMNKENLRTQNKARIV